jgi:hypothetical protein
MPADPTEQIRRALVSSINNEPGPRELLELEHGQVWDTGQMTTDFDVVGFGAPFVVVRRKSDGQNGTLMFQHRPRFYFAFREET